MQNGVPWWYFQRHGGPHEGRRLDTLDPNGTVAAHIDAVYALTSLLNKIITDEHGCVQLRKAA